MAMGLGTTAATTGSIAGAVPAMTAGTLASVGVGLTAGLTGIGAVGLAGLAGGAALITLIGLDYKDFEEEGYVIFPEGIDWTPWDDEGPEQEYENPAPQPGYHTPPVRYAVPQQTYGSPLQDSSEEKSSEGGIGISNEAMLKQTSSKQRHQAYGPMIHSEHGDTSESDERAKFEHAYRPPMHGYAKPPARPVHVVHAVVEEEDKKDEKKDFMDYLKETFDLKKLLKKDEGSAYEVSDEVGHLPHGYGPAVHSKPAPGYGYPSHAAPVHVVYQSEDDDKKDSKKGFLEYLKDRLAYHTSFKKDEKKSSYEYSYEEGYGGYPAPAIAYKSKAPVYYASKEHRKPHVIYHYPGPSEGYASPYHSKSHEYVPPPVYKRPPKRVVPAVYKKPPTYSELYDLSDEDYKTVFIPARSEEEIDELKSQGFTAGLYITATKFEDEPDDSDERGYSKSDELKRVIEIYRVSKDGDQPVLIAKKPLSGELSIEKSLSRSPRKVVIIEEEPVSIEKEISENSQEKQEKVIVKVEKKKN